MTDPRERWTHVAQAFRYRLNHHARKIDEAIGDYLPMLIVAMSVLLVTLILARF